MKEISSTEQVADSGTALLTVGTSWCTYCGKTYAALKEVMPGHPDVQLFKIDGDDEPDVLSEIGAKTYPQLLLYREGELVAQRESADAETLRAWLAENGVG